MKSQFDENKQAVLNILTETRGELSGYIGDKRLSDKPFNLGKDTVIQAYLEVLSNLYTDVYNAKDDKALTSYVNKFEKSANAFSRYMYIKHITKNLNLCRMFKNSRIVKTVKEKVKDAKQKVSPKKSLGYR